MKRIVFTSIGVFTVLMLTAIGMLVIYFPSSAQRTLLAKWEYAAITGAYVPFASENAAALGSAVNICVVQLNGCVNEEIKVEVVYSRFLQESGLENTLKARSLAQDRANQNAYAKAIAKLGAEGWEIVGPPGLEFDLYYLDSQGIKSVQEGNKESRPQIWFKRVKQ